MNKSLFTEKELYLTHSTIDMTPIFTPNTSQTIFMLHQNANPTSKPQSNHEQTDARDWEAKQLDSWKIKM